MQGGMRIKRRRRDASPRTTASPGDAPISAARVIRKQPFSPRAAVLSLERDVFSSNRHPALSSCLSMIFSENRYPLFRIMLVRRGSGDPEIALERGRIGLQGA